MHVVTPTEPHDEQMSETTTRTKDLTTVAWISSWPEQCGRYFRSHFQFTSVISASLVQLSIFASTVSRKSDPLQ